MGYWGTLYHSEGNTWEGWIEKRDLYSGKWKCGDKYLDD